NPGDFGVLDHAFFLSQGTCNAVAPRMLNGAAMHSIDSSPTLGQRVNSMFAQARFITFSLLVHAFIIIFGGTFAMYHQIPEPPDFVAGGGDGLMIEDAGASMPEPPPEAPQAELQPTLAPPASS